MKVINNILSSIERGVYESSLGGNLQGYIRTNVKNSNKIFQMFCESLSIQFLNNNKSEYLFQPQQLLTACSYYKLMLQLDPSLGSPVWESTILRGLLDPSTSTSIPHDLLLRVFSHSESFRQQLFRLYVDHYEPNIPDTIFQHIYFFAQSYPNLVLEQMNFFFIKNPPLGASEGIYNLLTRQLEDPEFSERYLPSYLPLYIRLLDLLNDIHLDGDKRLDDVEEEGEDLDKERISEMDNFSDNVKIMIPLIWTLVLIIPALLKDISILDIHKEYDLPEIIRKNFIAFHKVLRIALSEKKSAKKSTPKKKKKKKKKKKRNLEEDEISVEEDQGELIESDYSPHESGVPPRNISPTTVVTLHPKISLYYSCLKQYTILLYSFFPNSFFKYVRSNITNICGEKNDNNNINEDVSESTKGRKKKMMMISPEMNPCYGFIKKVVSRLLFHPNLLTLTSEQESSVDFWRGHGEYVDEYISSIYLQPKGRKSRMMEEHDFSSKVSFSSSGSSSSSSSKTSLTKEGLWNKITTLQNWIEYFYLKSSDVGEGEVGNQKYVEEVAYLQKRILVLKNDLLYERFLRKNFEKQYILFKDNHYEKLFYENKLKLKERLMMSKNDEIRQLKDVLRKTREEENRRKERESRERTIVRPKIFEGGVGEKKKKKGGEEIEEEDEDDDDDDDDDESDDIMTLGNVNGMSQEGISKKLARLRHENLKLKDDLDGLKVKIRKFRKENKMLMKQTYNLETERSAMKSSLNKFDHLSMKVQSQREEIHMWESSYHRLKHILDMNRKLSQGLVFKNNMIESITVRLQNMKRMNKDLIRDLNRKNNLLKEMKQFNASMKNDYSTLKRIMEERQFQNSEKIKAIQEKYNLIKKLNNYLTEKTYNQRINL